VLSDLVEAAAVAFADVPGLGAPSVAGHSGRIVVGALHDRPLLVFQGRLHFYEGHSWEVVGSPIRFAADVGIKTLLLTNAAGGIHPTLGPGSMMLIRDHQNWQRPDSLRENCRLTAEREAAGVGAKVSPYSHRLLDFLQQAGREIGEDLLCGTYAAMTGPCYETPAEIRALQAAGADAVGMSTAHEVETARALGLECAAISAITNKAAGLSEGVLDHHDVLQVMSGIRARLGRLIAAFVQRLDAMTLGSLTMQARD
jgi:purine-nucleoside phosphorylase